MDYINLYNKSQLKHIIDADINNKTIGHAYILSGQDELYLKYLSRCMAQKLINNHDDNCACSTCLKISKDIFCDVLLYPKNKETIVVEDVNEIVDYSYVYPLEADRKIFILNNFENCTIQAQNKLLKTLEEPNSYVTFILTSTLISSVLATIKSRSKLIEISKLNNEDIKNYILKNSSIKSTDVDMFVSSASGSITKANKIINDTEFVAIKELCLDMFLNMQQSSDVLKYSSKITKYNNRLSEVFDELNFIVLDYMKVKNNLNEYVKNKALINKLNQINYSLKALKLICLRILDAQKKLDSNCNPNAVVDNLLMGMLEEKHKWK